MTYEERVWAKVDRRGDDECWPWIGYVNRDGYGRMWRGPRAGGRPLGAHRVTYELLVGPIPEGLQLDHLCRNRRCVNPAHLEPVTNRENVLRGVAPSALNAVKTHCSNGHELSGDNLYIRLNGAGRTCRTCNRAASRRYEATTDDVVTTIRLPRDVLARAKAKATREHQSLSGHIRKLVIGDLGSEVAAPESDPERKAA